MLARRVDHVSFAVRDLERALAFYRDVLGLPMLPRPDFGVPGAWLAAGEGQIHLIQVPEGFDRGSPPGRLSPAASHTAFWIDDYAQVLLALKGHGLEVLEGGVETGQMWVQDPDGYVIELIAVRR